MSIKGFDGVREVSILGSPFQLLIEPSTSQANNTLADGEGLIHSTAGILTTFVVQARDKFGNFRNRGGDHVEVYAMTNDFQYNATVIDCMDGSYNVSYILTRTMSIFDPTDLGNGKYRVSFIASEIQRYSIWIMQNGIHIHGRSPYTVTVVPTIFSAENSEVIGDGLSISTSGVLATFIVRSRDTFGNLRSKGGESLRILLIGTQTLKISYTDNLDGQYNASYVPILAGDYLIYI
ncbi:hypothetical protein GUITHDRAFT_72223, partial [Guillardia theta CCMP2712]